MSTKKFVVSMNLAQALVAMGACYDERRKIGNKTIEQAFETLNEDQLNWLQENELIPAEALPAHQCYRGTLPEDKQVSYEKCPACCFYDRPMSKIRADLKPWLPNIAKDFAKGLASGNVTADSHYDTYVKLEDPILSKPSYKKPPEPKKVAAKKTAPKNTTRKPHKVQERPDFY
jgi:hypothetical protein